MLGKNLNIHITSGQERNILSRVQINSNLSASSISHGKLVAANTITSFRSPSSPVELLFTPSTCTRSSDFTLLDDSCSPEALDDYNLLVVSITFKPWQIQPEKSYATISSNLFLKKPLIDVNTTRRT